MKCFRLGNRRVKLRHRSHKSRHEPWIFSTFITPILIVPPHTVVPSSSTMLTPAGSSTTGTLSDMFTLRSRTVSFTPTPSFVSTQVDLRFCLNLLPLQVLSFSSLPSVSVPYGSLTSCSGRGHLSSLFLTPPPSSSVSGTTPRLFRGRSDHSSGPFFCRSLPLGKWVTV